MVGGRISGELRIQVEKRPGGGDLHVVAVGDLHDGEALALRLDFQLSHILRQLENFNPIKNYSF